MSFSRINHLEKSGFSQYNGVKCNKNPPLRGYKEMRSISCSKKSFAFLEQRNSFQNFFVPKMLCIFVIHRLMSELPKRSSEHTQKSQRISDECRVCQKSEIFDHAQKCFAFLTLNPCAIFDNNLFKGNSVRYSDGKNNFSHRRGRIYRQPCG